MKRKAIAIDVDDVLASHVEAFILFSNSNYGTNLQISDYDDQWVHMWQVEHEEISRRKAEFHQPANVAAFEFKEEARAALAVLASNYDLYVVTARPKELVEITHQWLEKHLPGVFKGVHFVPIWEPDNTITKADICKQLGAEYLIDDMPRHCAVVAEAGIQAILFGEYGWNKHGLTPGVTRCRDWKEVSAFFSAA